MKKHIASLLIAAILLSLFSILSFADGENLLSAADSFFESGTSAWEAFGDGVSVRAVPNPSGAGKVLGIDINNADVTWGSCALDLRTIIQSKASNAVGVKVTVDIYTESPVNGIMRLRNSDKRLSSCAANGYADVSQRIKTATGQWETFTGAFSVTAADLSLSSGKWLLCFDNFARTTDKFYIDNVSVVLTAPAAITVEQTPTAIAAPVPTELPVNAAPTTENLLENGSFEDGFIKPWEAYDGSSVSEDTLSQDDDDACVLIEDRGSNYATIIYRGLQDTIYEYGAGRYMFSCWAKLADTDAATASVVVRTSYGVRPASETSDYHVGASKINKNTWTQITFVWNFTDASENLIKVDLYFLCSASAASFPALYIDNVSMVKLDAVVTPAPTVEVQLPEAEQITRSETLRIGAIRWDCFTESTPDGTDPPSQVARILSPAQYHRQAPFFAELDENGNISFPEYTMDIWEQEAGYAASAGIDYFAYLWYATSNNMSKPRKFHLQSEKKDLVKMAGILEKNILNDHASMKELYSAMQNDAYLKLDGRCVLFLYDIHVDWSKKEIEKLRRDAASAGIDNALYIVGMCSDVSKLTSNIALGIDAVSWYGVVPDKVMSYAELAKVCEKTVLDLGNAIHGNNGIRAEKTQMIPSFTAGRDTRARIQTGASWIKGDPNAEKDTDKPYKNIYTLPATAEEIAEHAYHVFEYVKDHADITMPNLVLSYGWNEHDEGGWLCPTLTVDEAGNPIRDENGKIIADTSRIDALRTAVDRFRANEQSAAASPSLSPSPSAPGASSGGLKLLGIILPVAAVVVVAAAACVIIVCKKRAHNAAQPEAGDESNKSEE